MSDISKEDLRKEIEGILEGADLDTLSSKKVRQQLEEKLKLDLSDRKKEIDDLVMAAVEKKPKLESKEEEKNLGKDEDVEEELDNVENDEEDEVSDKDDEYEPEDNSKASKGRKSKGSQRKQPPRKAGGSDRFDEESEESADEKKKSPAKKRAKKVVESGSEYNDDSEDGSASSDEGSDEEYNPGKKGSPKKGKGKGGRKKRKADSESESGSDEDWKASNKKKRGAGGGGRKSTEGGASGGKGRGYTRAIKLSPELSTIVGAEAMPRHEVVKKMWGIIKERNLYDPKNKQFAVCDEQLQKVFGVKRFRTFGMMKYLKSHFLE